MQTLTNCVHGYDLECNVHASDVMRTRKSVHGIDSSMLKLFEFTNLSIFYLPCTWMILSCITFCEGHKLWKLSTVHWCYQPATIENYFSPVHRSLWFKKIRTTTTTTFLISKTVVPNPYSHSIAFDPQSFTQLS